MNLWLAGFFGWLSGLATIPVAMLAYEKARIWLRNYRFASCVHEWHNGPREQSKDVYERWCQKCGLKQWVTMAEGRTGEEGICAMEAHYGAPLFNSPNRGKKVA